MSHGEYGVGLYFSQRPSKAAHFSAVSSISQIIFKDVLFLKQNPTRHIGPYCQMMFNTKIKTILKA